MAKPPLRDIIVIVQRKGRKPEEWPIKGGDDNEVETIAKRIAKRRGWKDVEKIKAKGKP